MTLCQNHYIILHIYLLICLIQQYFQIGHNFIFLLLLHLIIRLVKYHQVFLNFEIQKKKYILSFLEVLNSTTKVESCRMIGELLLNQSFRQVEIEMQEILYQKISPIQRYLSCRQKTPIQLNLDISYLIHQIQLFQSTFND